MPDLALQIDGEGFARLNQDGYAILAGPTDECCCGDVIGPGCECAPAYLLRNCGLPQVGQCCPCPPDYELRLSAIYEASGGITGDSDRLIAGDQFCHAAPGDVFTQRDVWEDIVLRVECHRFVSITGRVRSYRRHWNSLTAAYVTTDDVLPPSLPGVQTQSSCTFGVPIQDLAGFLSWVADLAAFQNQPITDWCGGGRLLVGEWFQLSPCNGLSAGTPALEYRWTANVNCNGGSLEETGTSYRPWTSHEGNLIEVRQRVSFRCSWQRIDLADCPKDPCVNPPPAPVGACCGVFASSWGLPVSCIITSRTACILLGGVYRGDLTECVDANCQPVGACCLSDGSCIITTQAACQIRNGTFQGAGVPCGPNPCPAADLRACCLPDGSCIVTTFALCDSHGGVWQPAATTCVGVNCPPGPPIARGSCCRPDGSCLANVTSAECATVGGTWNANRPCGSPPCVPITPIPPIDNAVRAPVILTACSGCGGGLARTEVA